MDSNTASAWFFLVIVGFTFGIIALNLATPYIAKSGNPQVVTAALVLCSFVAYVFLVIELLLLPAALNGLISPAAQTFWEHAAVDASQLVMTTGGLQAAVFMVESKKKLGTAMIVLALSFMCYLLVDMGLLLYP